MEILKSLGRPEDDPSYARILYRNLLTATTTTAAQPSLNPNTWERWQSASGTMAARFQMAAQEPINCIAIAAHNLGSTGSLVQVETSATIGGGMTAKAALTPKDNSPLMFFFDEVSAQEIRVTITGGTNRELGVIYAGKAMIMERALYGNHSPITLSSQTEYRNAISDTGQFLGRTIRRKGLQTSFSWQYLTPDWYRETFQPFVESAKTKPFFIQWRPDHHTNEIAYGFTTGDIQPTNMGGGIRYLSAGFTMRSHD